MVLNADELNLGNSGFGIFLGAGASFEAGYPLMTTLTSSVLKSLNGSQVNCIANLVGEELESGLDVENGTPNIEIISDLLEIRAVTLGPVHGKEYNQLAHKVRDVIVEVLQAVTNPDLTHHIRLLESFRRIKEGQTTPLCIFTTNYDLLIERAATEVGVPLYDGFIGGPTRFLKPSSLSWCHGTISNQYGRPQFESRTGPYINLVKLHGSIGWWIVQQRNGQQGVYACLDSSLIRGDLTRAMIMPQRSKVHDVLGPPYDQLWEAACSVLGTQCKYIVTSGYSFGDDHINRKLFVPRLANGKLKLIALVYSETEGLSAISHFASMTYCSKDTKSNGGIKSSINTDLWKFSSFVDLIARYAGI